ncbi:hypothetical protein CfE428DRAFT_1591 [Chthoniobacter flavus Ellin428]|uniref:Uncharacterized protein n=1 Tax=Chthoniobacter flavus Ellin428 TaxID=497964 RepID=B4CWX8_9BACT|nr:hypothetical protein CfE428DRAFT_1591 [Chthoniobacter flavus Ellin428]
MAAVHLEDADRLRLIFADERGIHVRPAQADHGADAGEDARELIRPFPSRDESADCAAAATADGVIVAVLAEDDLASVTRRFLLHHRQQLIEQEARIAIAHAVVFVAAIVTIQRLAAIERFDHPGANENADRYRYIALRDEVVENHRRIPLHAVLVHIQARRLGAVVLLRHIDRHLAGSARENLRLGKVELDQLAFGHVGVRLGIFALRVIRLSGRQRRDGEQNGNGQGEWEQVFHEIGRNGREWDQ